MIPQKLWFRLTDALLDYRTNPCCATLDALDTAEVLVGWPWSASKEQREEWQNICDRTRAEYELKLGER